MIIVITLNINYNKYLYKLTKPILTSEKQTMKFEI